MVFESIEQCLLNGNQFSYAQQQATAHWIYNNFQDLKEGYLPDHQVIPQY
jgi:hypothetical protein